MAIDFKLTNGGLLKTSGLGALAAALAMMALPAEALAQNRGDRAREWQQSQSSSRAGPSWHSRTTSQSQSSARTDGGGSWRGRSSQEGQSSARERATTRVENRGDRRANRIDNRSERQANRVENRGDWAARRTAQNGNDWRARRIDNRTDQAARQIERRGDWRADRVDGRSEQRADRIRNGERGDWQNRDRNRGDYSGRDGNRGDRSWRDGNRGDRAREWQRSRNWRNDNNWRNDGRRYSDNRDHRRWSRNWRHDNRYDWRDYRTRHRHVYRLGRYYSPYRDWHYSRLTVGFSLAPLFYSSSYWIEDPWHYRLPPAYGSYRWIRYYDDALLVDIYTGEVIDVIYDFFW